MELKLIIDGKEKTFKQNKTTFVTMQKALAWQDRVTKQFEEFAKRTNVGIEEEVEFEVFDPMDDANMAVDFIVTYFGGQFTYDDFINSPSFESISDIYNLANLIGMQILGAKESNDTLKKTNKLLNK